MITKFLGSLKFNDSSLYVKTGTSSFDSTTLKKYNYPNNSSKDIWLAGFNKQYSFAIWSGFDLPKKGEENYFKVGSDIRKNYHKQILKLVLQKATTTNEDVTISDAVSKVNIVKGTNLLPNALTPSYLITEAYFKKGYEPSEIIKEEPLTPVNDISFLIYANIFQKDFSKNIYHTHYQCFAVENSFVLRRPQAGYSPTRLPLSVCRCLFFAT